MRRAIYLKTIGRILPERWNKWAKNILHYNTTDNGVQTDNLFNSDKEKVLKDENEKLQEKLKEMNELTEQVKSLGEEKEIFAKFFAAQAQQIEDLELENEELKSKLAGLKKNYRELAEIAQKRGEEFLAQFKEKSKEILHLQKELTERSKEFANKIEMLSVEIEKKDGKIRSLTELNKVLEQKKKEMETKNNEQKQTIIEEEKRIREQDNLIKSFHENKDINETVKKENENLQAQNTELESKFSQLKNESDTKINQLESQLKEKQAELEQAKKKNTELDVLKKQLEKEKIDWEDKLNVSEEKKKKLEDEVKELKEHAEEKNAEVENLKQQLEKEKDELKYSSSKLNATETEKKELEGEVKELKEKLQILEKNSAEIEKQKADLEKKLEFSQGENKKLQEQVEHLSVEQEKAKSVAVLSITDSTKTLNENLTLKNQQIESSIAEVRQQKLKNEQKDAGKKSEGMNKKTKAQAKTKEVDTVSTVSIAKLNASKILKRSKNFFVNKNLEDFLSDQNKELKKGFPEFKEKHFCHNVLEKTIQSLVYQNSYKFKSDKLLALLEENLVQSGRAIIEDLVKKVVTRAFEQDVKKNSVIQVSSVQKCAKELYLNEEDSQAIISSFIGFLGQKNDSNNDSVKKFIVKELIKAQIKCFSDKVQGLQLASSIRDKFLSPDQGMCNQTQGGVNEYQLTEKAKKEYKLTPNPSMSHTNSTPVSVKQEATSR